jgi:hypothetical protein
MCEVCGPILSEDLDEVDCVTTGEKNMVASNPNNRFQYAGSNAVPPVNRLAERVRHYFDQHPEVSRQEFLLEAVLREIHFREQREKGNKAGTERRGGDGTSRWFTPWPPLSAEDVRIHARLMERLAALNYERYGLWPRLRRFLFADRLVRWLGIRQGLEVRSQESALRS